MVSSEQIRAARALLGWTQEMLADKSLVSLTALKKLEAGRKDVREATSQAVRKTLEKQGITFLSSSNTIGVMLQRRRS
jgi:predicted transcriptional regulator